MSLLLFLPETDDAGWRWRRDDVAGAGSGVPDRLVDEPVFAIAPAAAVTLHWAELPDRSFAQAAAAARLLVAEAAAAPIATLHVAIGHPEADGTRAIAVVAAERMLAWVGALAAAGVDPVAVVPAPLLLPRPADGYVRGDPGGGMVVRGTSAAFAEEPVLSALIAGEAETLAPGPLAASIDAALAVPPLDLLQGAFARTRRRTIDRAALRRIALLGAMVLAATLMIDLVTIARYTFDATALEARADALSRAVLPAADAQGDVARLLRERLAGLRGPGRGFTPMAAQVFAVVRDVGDSTVTRLDFDATGDLRVGVTAGGEARANAIRTRLAASGFRVEASTFESQGARVSGTLTVRAP